MVMGPVEDAVKHYVLFLRHLHVGDGGGGLHVHLGEWLSPLKNGGGRVHGVPLVGRECVYRVH